MSSTANVRQALYCYHCGESCSNDRIRSAEKLFCCEGCKMVYGILNQHELCDYYDLNKSPGINQRTRARSDKFAYLDESNIQSQLIGFRNDRETHVNFYLPQMHCSSCLYLLENLHRIEPAVISSKINFTRKEIDIVFQSEGASLRKVVETLSAIGYEPYISLHELQKKKPKINKSLTYQLGVAGFCFGNIMLMSFPEYLGIDESETGLRSIFRWLNVGLSIPVFLYSALPFYQSSWKSLTHKFLNIDAPIALAIIITFIRSLWEVVSGEGGGYFDSMTGIVFFMLAGRIIQDKTHRQLSFERDYTSYFPIAVSVLKENKEKPVLLPDIKPGDTLVIHNDELIPADGILTKGKAWIDYSFVTGESIPVRKEVGELLYAGGKQTEGPIELLVIKEVAQSYLTNLWNNDSFQPATTSGNKSFVHLLSRYFTYIVLIIALITAVFWQWKDPSLVWPAVTSIFIIACPCALFLSNTFTNGNILQILSRNKFYLRNAQTIEDISGITNIVFDKTGTLTSTLEQDINYEGRALTKVEKASVVALAACSNHPLSKALVNFLGTHRDVTIDGFKEFTGFGILGNHGKTLIKLGSWQFVKAEDTRTVGTTIFVSINNEIMGFFRFRNHYRNEVEELVKDLKKDYKLSVLSGDNNTEQETLRILFGCNSQLLFNQGPANKLEYIKQLQKEGEKVMMIGDGLNDAGALKQSNIGIAITEYTNNFTPSSDAILEAKQLPMLTRFIHLCKANKKIVEASFIVSIIYNIIGLFFAVQGTLSPLIAAILMPSSSLGILLLTFGTSNFIARRMKL